MIEIHQIIMLEISDGQQVYSLTVASTTIFLLSNKLLCCVHPRYDKEFLLPLLILLLSLRLLYPLFHLQQNIIRSTTYALSKPANHAIGYSLHFLFDPKSHPLVHRAGSYRPIDDKNCGQSYGQSYE